MLVRTRSDRTWQETGHPGIERSLFRNNDAGGRSSVVRLLAGTRVPRHVHHGSEEVLVLSGTVRISGVELQTGDYLYTEAGKEHDVAAVTDAEIFVSTTRPTAIVE